MYLISVYFDEKTDRHIRNLMKLVAKKTGNNYMIEGNVPPHITISAIEARDEAPVIAVIESVISEIKTGKLTWASVAAFLPHVIYLAPVLNECLYSMNEKINCQLKEIDGICLRVAYQPFNWIPHTTIAKKLTSEEMKIAFETLQKSFGKFEGKVARIGLAKTNPYEDIRIWELEET